MANARDPLLQVSSISSGYGSKEVVTDVSLQVSMGEIVAVIGHNGAGKSTLLKTVFGLLPRRHGTLSISGQEVVRPSPQGLIERGVRYLPQGHLVFGTLTVRENLQMGIASLRNEGQSAQNIQSALSQFPQLRTLLNRRASALSGGEKQALSIATALISDPRLLLADEPSLGLAPRAASAALQHFSDLCRSAGMGALIVEQKVREVLRISDRVYVLRNGHIVYHGPSAELFNETLLRKVYL